MQFQEFNFKNWLILSENVVINDLGTEATLNVVEPSLIRDFNYQFENGYSTFFISAYQARRVGYAHISDRPTHVGITKTTPIEAGTGTDIAFLRNLTSLLTKNNLKAEPYKEGGEDWNNILKNIPGFEDIKQKLGSVEDKENLSKVPEFSQGASNARKITSSMSVSRASGSWSFYFRCGDNPSYMIDAALRIMKEAIKPLLNADVVDFYEIVDRKSQKRLEMVYSKKGQSEHDDWHNQYQKIIAHLKWLAQVLLKNYPHAQKLVIDQINHVGVKIIGGGTKHQEEDIQPQKNNIPLQTIKDTIKTSHASYTLEFFIDAVKTDNERFYEIMEESAKTKNPGYILYVAKFLIDNEWEQQDTFNHLYDYLTIFKSQNVFKEMCPKEFDKFHNEIEKDISNIKFDELTKSDIKTLKELSDYIKIRPEILSAIDQLDAHIKQEEQERKTKEESVRRKRKFIVGSGDHKYLVLAGNGKINEWENIPQKYINYHDQIDYGWFAEEEIVDHEDIFYKAYEKAMEKAYENAEERPSESYGKDKDEVIGDIGYDWDDFVNNQELDDLSEDADEEQWIKLIKEKYYDKFVEWKIKELREKEDEEKWRYEPEEPDEQDVHEAESELAEEVAFAEYGLIIIIGEENNDLKLEFNHKYKEQLIPLVKETVSIMLKEKDDEFNETLLKSHNKIIFDYRDKNKQDSWSSYDFVRKHGN